MTLRFHRAVIHGVGLLGGSLGLALRHGGLADQVVGWGRSAERLEEAKRLGAIDEAATDAEAALTGADAVFLCASPEFIREVLAEHSELIESGAFITDVGSVKHRIVKAAEQALPSGALFIGSHPMAGSDRSGVGAASGNLFEGACCILTPTNRTPGEALSRATSLWRSLGGRVAVMTPERHDVITAAISHLPHLAAASLVRALFDQGDATLLYRALAGAGFRDTTRVAAGEPGMWRQIFTENAPALVDTLDGTIKELQDWRGLLASEGNADAIEAKLAEASRWRKSLEPGADDAS